MIYLDHAATSPLRPEVLEAMLPHLRDGWGNASSLHASGRAARKAMEDAREQVADWIGARPGEIVFTSGGSESDSSLIAGLAFARRERGRHLLTTPIEHPAVLRTVEFLAGQGFEVELLPGDAVGRIDPDEVAARLRDETILVSVMHANNEIGTVQPIAAIAGRCGERRVPLHSDGVQTLGGEGIEVDRLGVAMMSFSAHKIGGPKGVGFSYVRTGVRPKPWILGGSQERRRRAGTENVPGIVGLAAAIESIARDWEADQARMRRLRDRLLDGLLCISGAHLNGPREGRLANNVNLSFARVSGESLLIMLDQRGICASSGSACSSGATDPSHVLLAIGQCRDLAYGSLRLTLGRETTDAEIDAVLDLLPGCVERLRELAPAVSA